MYPASAERVSELLLHWEHSGQNAREDLIPLAFVELRRIAHRLLWPEHPDYTPQRGTLVHKTYLCLLREEPSQWRNGARPQQEMKQKEAHT
jgi:hypothetical protein